MARSSEREERGFRYRRTTDDVKARANMKGGGFDSIVNPKFKTYKVKDGKNLIRILPATWKGANHYGYDLWINYGIGIDNQSYLSLSKMKNEKDPIAEALREAERSGDKELAKSLKPRQRILMWVIDRNAEDEGPQLFACPFTLDKAIANLSHDEDTRETIFVEDEKDGADIRFYKEGSGLKTDYPAEKIRILKASPLCDDLGLADEWMTFVEANPLPDCVQFYDYNHIANVFNGGGASDEDDERPRSRSRNNGRGNDDDEEETPRRSRAKEPDEEDENPRRRAYKDNDGEEPPRRTRGRVDPDEDTEERTPSRGRGRIRDDEDSEEEKPRRARVVDDEGDDPKPRGSIRDRLSRQRQQVEADD